MDGAALYVGKNHREVVQGREKPLPAPMIVFAPGDVVGQVLQNYGGLFTMFFCDGPGERVDVVGLGVAWGSICRYSRHSW